MGKILVIGSSNTDLVFRTNVLPGRGETVLGRDFQVFAGGKGANQAVAAARAGGEVVFITRTGEDDFGKKALEEYHRHGIDLTYVEVDSTAPSGLAVILIEDSTGQNSIVVAPGANNRLMPEHVRLAESAFEGADVLLCQLEIPVDTVQEALQIAHSRGLMTILNPAPATELSPALLSLVDVITPNETEAFLLTGITPGSPENIREAARSLLSRVRKMVVITLGADGLYFLHRDGRDGFLPAIPVNAVDTTAAGDVFNGYLAVALAEGKTLETALSWAIQAASLSVTRQGAQASIPGREEFLS